MSVYRQSLSIIYCSCMLGACMPMCVRLCRTEIFKNKNSFDESTTCVSVLFWLPSLFSRVSLSPPKRGRWPMHHAFTHTHAPPPPPPHIWKSHTHRAACWMPTNSHRIFVTAKSRSIVCRICETFSKPQLSSAHEEWNERKNRYFQATEWERERSVYATM